MRLGLAISLLLLVTPACQSKRSKAAPAAQASAAAKSAASSAAEAPALPPDAKELSSGGHWQLVRPGTQPGPEAPSRMQLNVTVWDASGTQVYATQPGRSMVLGVEVLSPALQEMVRLTGVGGIARAWLPPSATEGWRPSNFPAGDLSFELEIVATLPATSRVFSSSEEAAAALGSSSAAPRLPPSASAAPDSADPPKDARSTASGLKYVISRPGTGGGEQVSAKTLTRLSVDGWAARGLTIVQVIHGHSISMTAGSAPAGLAEVLQQLAPGGRARVWAAASKAQALFPSSKSEPLILDVTLVSAKND